MNVHSKPYLVTLAGVSVVVLGLTACTGEAPVQQAPTEQAPTTATPATATPATQAPTAATPAVEAGLAVVANDEVCMVNDTFFAREQIPVTVDGETYYGCCAACEQRLTEDEAVRHAVDPASGERVDKATATIAARPDGSVLYFANEENLAKYRADGGA